MTFENILLSLIWESAWYANIPSHTLAMLKIADYLAKMER